MSSVADSDMHRNVADFQPSVWGDYFLRYASESMVQTHTHIYIYTSFLPYILLVSF